jgi:hypothetical protein
MATAFDAQIRSVAVRFCVAIQLAPCALDYVLGFIGWFDFDDFVLETAYFVDLFVVGCGFEVYKEEIEGFLCLTVFGIDYVSDLMA